MPGAIMLLLSGEDCPARYRNGGNGSAGVWEKGPRQCARGRPRCPADVGAELDHRWVGAYLSCIPSPIGGTVHSRLVGVFTCLGLTVALTVPLAAQAGTVRGAV